VFGGVSLATGQPGYRDMLCDRIAHVVRVASVVDGERIFVVLDDDSSISISLRADDRQGVSPEAATFTADGHTWVW